MGDLLDLHAFREKRKAKAERKARRQFELDSNAIVNTGCVVTSTTGTGCKSMIDSLDNYWASCLAAAHASGEIPHGPELPSTGGHHGDLFVLEEPDGTDTLYSCIKGFDGKNWLGLWNREVAGLMRPCRESSNG